MGTAFEAGDGRLAADLAAMLEPEVQDALDHPIRREVLRTLGRSDRPRGAAEIRTALGGLRLSELSYHLQVLRQAGAVASSSLRATASRGRGRYASEWDGDRQVRAVLRATEREDREWREAAARVSASPLLTMFRVPRSVRTIRLRGGSQFDVGRER